MIAPPATPLARKTISAAVADELRRRIFEGVYPGGAQLRQDALAADFGVSRIPVREALVQLEGEGLVRIEPHRGASVTPVSSADIAELFDLRALIEPALLRLSAPLLTETDFAALDALLAEFEAGEARRRGELNAALHLRLYSRAARPRMLALAQSLLRESDRHTRLQLTRTRGLARAQREHAELVALCRAGRTDEAAALCERHIRHVQDSLTKIVAGGG
ncbi:MAG: GntR family transcriptional regulator [Methylobacteriaceae bacterium]|nr:GntR family transcriptional regulator [Methylobacteriaceae bacterium]